MTPAGNARPRARATRRAPASASVLGLLLAGGALLFLFSRMDRLDSGPPDWKPANGPPASASGTVPVPSSTSNSPALASDVGPAPPDPFASTEQLADHPPEIASVDAALAGWAEKEVARALEWIEEQGIHTLEFSVREQLLEGLLRMEPQAALERLDGSSSPVLREDMLRLFLRRLAEVNPGHAAVELLLRDRDNGLVRPAVGDGIIDQWMRQDPEAAAGLLAELPDGRERNRATLAAVEAWSELAPAQTAAWVETLPAGESRDEAFRRMTLAWSGQDLGATMAWLQRLPAGGSRDVAIASLCGQLADIYPVMLSAWAATIGDAGLRRRTLTALSATGGG